MVLKPITPQTSFTSTSSPARSTPTRNDPGMRAAIAQAKLGLSEGGIPIGACLVGADGKIIGQGRNMRVQRGSATLHVCTVFSYFLFVYLSWKLRSFVFVRVSWALHGRDDEVTLGIEGSDTIGDRGKHYIL